MSIYRRGNLFSIYVPTRGGGRVVKATNCSHKPTAKRMEAMIADLGPKGRRDWELLDAIAEGRLTVGQLYDAYSAQKTDELKQKLADINVEPHVIPWFESVRSRVSESSDTHIQYLTKVRSLIPAGEAFYRTEFTYPTLTKWIANLEWSNSTKRKYHAAMSSFCEHLKRSGILQSNPMRDVEVPPANAARMRYLEHADVVRLIEAQPEPFRTLSALMHGTGIEISVAVALKCRDVDRARKEIHAHGTKTKYRDRIAVVEGWAWAYLERHIADMLPNADVFPRIDRWIALDRHREACAALGIENYTQHDARHTYAVRAIRAGAPFEVVARQLGHGDTTQVIKVYGRYRPTADEFRKWESIAAAQDFERVRAG